MVKHFRVGVFTEWRNGRKPRISAYTLWFNPAWAGCCIHEVEANTGAEAKKLAIADHKQKCMSPSSSG